MSITVPTLAYLICGSPARNHDFDSARIRLHQALYAAGNIRTDVANNYDDATAILNAEMLVTYTSQVPVGDEQCAALRSYLENGGRWFAIHASNSVKENPHLPGILGSRFLAHPPYMHYSVDVAKTTDPLLDGLAAHFEVDDELYVIEQRDDIEVLLETEWGGDAMGHTYPNAVRPLMYRRPVGSGGVLYLALGHANRPFDKPRPERPDAPDHRGPWDLPVYQELIRRGIDWAAGRRPL
ncbi:MAG TPA: ThuA domain-containing protein [Chloroflexota bacterium]|nr:ThuA domain-containing protein [Chloroflexota bacterium]